MTADGDLLLSSASQPDPSKSAVFIYFNSESHTEIQELTKNMFLWLLSVIKFETTKLLTEYMFPVFFKILEDRHHTSNTKITHKICIY